MGHFVPYGATGFFEPPTPSNNDSALTPNMGTKDAVKSPNNNNNNNNNGNGGPYNQFNHWMNLQNQNKMKVINNNNNNGTNVLKENANKKNIDKAEKENG